MLKIRLMRIGAKGRPFYRVVVVDERNKRNGAYLDLLGTYNPLTEPKEIKIDSKKLEEWLKKGAQKSDGLLRILKEAPQKHRKPKKEQPVEAAPKAEEAPTEAAPSEETQDAGQASMTEETPTEPATETAAETPAEQPVETSSAPEGASEGQGNEEKAQEATEAPAEEVVSEEPKAEEAVEEMKSEEKAEEAVEEGNQ